MRIKIEAIFFLAAAVFLFTNCSVSKKETTTNTTQENTNVTAQTNQNSTEVPPDSAAGAQGKETVSPDALIKDLYKTHEKNAGTILNPKSRTQIDKYFDKNLGGLIWKDLTTHDGEIGVIDFDIFYNTQDPNIKNLVVSPAKIEGTKATVVVNFTNTGQKETITYSLVQQNTAWKISDIKYTDGSLLGYFKEAAKNNSTADKPSDEVSGNFEGTFQVGSTTAIVIPVKMAFELKWAKGSGTMVFHYEGQDGVLKYVSDDKGNGVDAFVFDDDTFKTGKFVRADGNIMPVKKIK